jgi:hypothetical protein
MNRLHIDSLRTSLAGLGRVRCMPVLVRQEDNDAKGYPIGSSEVFPFAHVMVFRLQAVSCAPSLCMRVDNLIVWAGSSCGRCAGCKARPGASLAACSVLREF